MASWPFLLGRDSPNTAPGQSRRRGPDLSLLSRAIADTVHLAVALALAGLLLTLLVILCG